MRAFAASCLALVVLAACAQAPAPYSPISANRSGTGYSEIRIEADRWRVTFTGSGSVSEAQVERLALRRAGQVVLQNGYEWFEIVDRRFSAEGRGGSPVRVGGSVGRSWGSRGWSGSSVGLGVSLSPNSERRITASLEIIAGVGEPRPERAYDALSVSRPMGAPPY